MLTNNFSVAMGPTLSISTLTRAVTSTILAGLLLLLLLSISACSHQTTVSEATTYLQAQALQVEIDSYKNQLAATRTRLTEVLPQFQNASPLPPASLSGDLAAFLASNDCLTATDKKYCYQLTLMRLIDVTRQLDDASLNNWAAKRTIGQLTDNINTIIEGLERKNNSTIPDSVKSMISRTVTAVNPNPMPDQPGPKVPEQAIPVAPVQRELPVPRNSLGDPPK